MYVLPKNQHTESFNINIAFNTKYKKKGDLAM